MILAAPALDAFVARQSVASQPKILILSLPHGAAHQRAAKALREAFAALRPDARVEVIDTLQHCTAWFRAYYNSYLIPLAIWPGLWRWIENRQHQSESTSPGWVYRQGAQPLFRYLRDFAPDVVIATEVGTCELAAMYKRETPADFLLVGLELMDFNRAWVQPEVDLFLTTHIDLAAELVAEGASAAKVVTTGQPIHPVFASLPGRRTARDKLGIKPDALQLLVLFGGTGHGKPERILAEVTRVQHPHEIVLVTGRNQRLEKRLRQRYGSLPHVRVLGWVDNMQEWMVASDLMISKPGGGTLTEGFACGLPMLAFDPLPGNEERTCRWIEKWGAGIWIEKPEDLAPKIETLLADAAQLAALRHKAGALARPYAARDGALATLEFLSRERTCTQPSRILILAVHHGSTHVQIARVLQKALRQLRPNVQVEIIDTLAHCRRWFRAYYDAFEIPLKYWPGLWERIETRQYRGKSTGPLWLYRWGAQPLFRFIEAFAPHVIVATEVGLCEMAVLHKRQTQATYSLVGIGALDFERPWAQPEVDLFISSPGEVAGQLKSAGVAPERIVECGMPVDPVFTPCADKTALRARLGLERELPALLVNFGGSGRMKPRQVVSELRRIQQPFQVVFIARRDEKLREDLLRLTAGMPHVHVLRWVDNMQEWMAAADILVSRAGSCTVAEALNCGLPIVVFDAPPGSERRVCELVEKKWQTGYWAKCSGDIATRLNHLLTKPPELERLRRNTAQHAYPRAAHHAAEAILRLCP